jgi:hypothetical protein
MATIQPPIFQNIGPTVQVTWTTGAYVSPGDTKASIHGSEFASYGDTPSVEIDISIGAGPPVAIFSPAPPGLIFDWITAINTAFASPPGPPVAAVDIISPPRIRLGHSSRVAVVGYSLTQLSMLTNEIRSAPVLAAPDYNAHLVDPMAHPGPSADPVNTSSAFPLSASAPPAPAATIIADCIAILNDVKTFYNMHVSSGPPVHGAPDLGNVVTAPNATDLSSAITLANDISAKYNAHIASAPIVHLVPDGTNMVTTPPITPLSTQYGILGLPIVDRDTGAGPVNELVICPSPNSQHLSDPIAIPNGANFCTIATQIKYKAIPFNAAFDVSLLATFSNGDPSNEPTSDTDVISAIFTTGLSVVVENTIMSGTRQIIADTFRIEGGGIVHPTTGTSPIFLTEVKIPAGFTYLRIMIPKITGIGLTPDIPGSPNVPGVSCFVNFGSR